MIAIGSLMQRKAGGRPKLGDGDGGTRQVRVFEDLADVIGWIVRIKGGSSAKLLDPLLRDQLYAVYEEIEADVERIKKGEEIARKALEEAERKHRDQQAKRPPKS